MKNKHCIKVLICGLMTLVLDQASLAADVRRVEGSCEGMSIESIEVSRSHSGHHSHRHRRKNVASFISYFSNESQNIGPSTTALLAFTTAETTNDKILPTASNQAPIGTFDTFTVTISGIYLISWNVAITTGNNVNATLDLLIDGTPINSPFESQGYGGGGGGAITGAVSGSFLVSVNGGQSIQLEVSAFVGDITANSPSISILKVADIP